MADGDPSLDGGLLGNARLGQCYENLDELKRQSTGMEAQSKESPEVADCRVKGERRFCMSLLKISFQVI